MSPVFRQLDDQRQALQHELAALPAPPEIETSERLGWRIFEYQIRPWRGPEWVELDFGASVDFDAIALIPTYLATTDLPGPGYGFPLRFRVEAFGEDSRSSVIADASDRDFPKPGVLPVWLPAPGGRARRIRLTILAPWQRERNLHASSLAEFMVLQGRRNLATGRPGVTVRTSDSREGPPAWSRDNLIDGQSPLGAPLGRRIHDLESAGHCWHSQLTRSPHAVKWVQVDLGRSYALDEVRLVPARLPQRLHRDGYGFPVRFRVEAADEPDFAQPRLLADYTATPFRNPGFNPVTIPAGAAARYLRVTATELQHRGDGQYLFALAELQAYVADTNVARGRPVSFLDNLEASRNWRAAFLTDGARWEDELGEWPDWLAGLSRRREVLGQLATLEGEIAPLQLLLTRILIPRARASTACAIARNCSAAISRSKPRPARARPSSLPAGWPPSQVPRPAMTETTRPVWLIEDNASLRRNVARVVDAVPGFRCTDLYYRCEDAIARLRDPSVPRPAIILLDVGLPGMSGLDGIGPMKAAGPAVQIVILTAFEDDEKIYRAICAGASGYLLKSASFAELAAALGEVAAGGSPMTPRVARRVLEMFSRLAPQPTAQPLSPREREVIEFMAEGLTNKEIASRLSLSVHTVTEYVGDIYRKLHVNTRAGAVAKALRAGWV